MKYLSVFVISTSVRIETLLILHQNTYLSSSGSSIQGSLNIWNLMFVLTPGFVSIWVQVSVKYFIIPCKCRVYRSFIYRITDLHMPQMSMFCSLRIERHNQQFPRKGCFFIFTIQSNQRVTQWPQIGYRKSKSKSVGYRFLCKCRWQAQRLTTICVWLLNC